MQGDLETSHKSPYYGRELECEDYVTCTNPTIINSTSEYTREQTDIVVIQM